MTTAAHPATAPAPAAPSPAPAPVVDVVIPVHDEVVDLERSVRTVRAYLDAQFPFSALVTIADNASTDGTWEVAARLAAQMPGVRAVHLNDKGRGRALKAAWSSSRAEVLVYMDVDLSTDLDGMLPLVAPLLSGHSDVAIGSRLAPGAHVLRGAKREMISRAYNLMLRTVLRTRVRDAQCGFKAVRADAARRLLPLVADDGWFFDTELLALAEHNGMRIHEVPVDWVDDPDSRVEIVKTALVDLRGTVRLWRGFATGGGRIAGPALRPRPGPASSAVLAGVGGVTTLAYVVAFLCVQPALGGPAANAVAWTAASAGNAALHRLAATDADDLESRRDRIVRWACGLALSTVALTATDVVTTSLPVDVVVLLAAGVVVSAARFAALRQSRYRRHLDEACRPSAR